MSKKLKKNKTNRILFVPLIKESFRWYSQGKKWEVRKLRGQYTMRNIITGRRVELREGYTGSKKFGRIQEVIVVDDSEELFKRIDFKEIIPVAIDLEDAKKRIARFLNESHRIIAFRILLEN